MQHVSSDSQRASKARRQWQLGQSHAKAGRWEAAQRAHQTAAQLVPGDSVYALNNARALLSRGLFAAASAEALRAYAIAPGDVIACEFAAECLMRENRYPQAVETLRSLPAGAPRNHIHHALFGLALLRAGQQQQAIGELFQCLAMKPDWAEMHHNLGLCFGDLDMQFEAAQCFNTALLLGVGKLELGTRRTGLLLPARLLPVGRQRGQSRRADRRGACVAARLRSGLDTVCPHRPGLGPR